MKQWYGASNNPKKVGEFVGVMTLSDWTLEKTSQSIEINVHDMHTFLRSSDSHSCCFVCKLVTLLNIPNFKGLVPSQPSSEKFVRGSCRYTMVYIYIYMYTIDVIVRDRLQPQLKTHL